MDFCNKDIFQLHSTRNALKVIQIKWATINKLKTKFFKPTLIISICQIYEAIVGKSLISRFESVLTALRKTIKPQPYLL